MLGQDIKPALFLSTPSVGRATLLTMALITSSSISIHALRGEGDPSSLVAMMS